MGFSKDFLWGLATSAGQIEGGAYDDGRGPSIWDVFASKPGKIQGGDTPERACGSYRNFDRDLQNLIFEGVDSYRMSISWSRVMPDGKGELNQKGVDYYKRCFDSLLNAGIKPNVTLYHWDLPQALEDENGWVNRDTIKYFGQYAEKMFRLYGDVVPLWATVNEPIATYVGYALGAFAPGRKNEKEGNQARHNILVAHGEAVDAFRASGAKGDVGIVIDVWKRHALRDTEEDRRLVIDEDERNWKFYTDPVLGGRYSDYLLSHLQSEGTLMDIYDGDLEKIHRPIDFYGLNVYNRVPVSTDRQAVADFSQGGNFLNNKTEYYPKAIYDAIRLVHDLYGLRIPIYVTENGTYAIGDEKRGPDGTIEDADRIKYISGFIEWLEKAVDEGYDVRGYYLWSLMDNFEWTAGYSYRFGIFETDLKTMQCRPKRSALWYRDHIKKVKGK
ncbi:MAG: family 1 glycosylhydrolase [Clostridia bacterium]|nr:family 1 glycosylhydrolase [Clostridia bacterium]